MPPGRQRALLALLLLAATLAVYAQVRDQDFLGYDDPIYVSQNSHLEGGLSPDALAWAFEPHEANWIPLTFLSLQVDYTLFGPDAGAFKAVNGLLHAASALILFLFLVRATGAAGRSAFVAFVFALHPLHVESVAWVSERKDALSGLFWMLSMAAYGRYSGATGGRALGWYAACLAALVLGLMTKSLLVTLPFALLLLDYWPLDRLRDSAGRLDRRRVLGAIADKVPMLPLIAASAVVTYLVQQDRGAMSTFEAIPLAVRLQNALVSYVAYLGKAFWPTDLAIFYPHSFEPLATGPVAAAAALLVAASAVAVVFARRVPALAVGWFWYLGTLVPMIGIVQVGMQSMADRYTYIPLVGIAIAVAWGVPAALAPMREPMRGRLLATAGGLAVSSLAVVTWHQLGYWHDDGRIFARAIDVTDENFIAHHLIGRYYVAEEQPELGLEHLAEAVRIRPRWGRARASLAEAQIELERLDDAILNLSEAARLEPDDASIRITYGGALVKRGWHGDAVPQYRHALRIDDGGELTPSILALLSDALRLNGNLAQASASLDRALALDPDHAGARVARALLQLETGDLEDAVEPLQAAVASAPDAPELHEALGDAYLKLGAWAESAASYREALRLRPGWAEPSNNLAWILATASDPAQRDPEAALGFAEAATATGREEADVLDTLAVCLASVGRFDDAVAVLDEALALASDPGTAEPLRARRALFARRQPYAPAAEQPE